MMMQIALAGNPNCGKTTMFNALTGSSQYVGNWPGVTVEKKVGKLKGSKDVEIVDLPGIYSLSPYTLEEVVSRNYLLEEKPNAIINIVDSTNIERNLYLTTQLIEIGIPMVIALNMTDILRKNGDIINVKELSEKLGCPIVETSALKGDGCKEAVEKAIALAQQNAVQQQKHYFSDTVQKSIDEIKTEISDEIEEKNTGWYAVKLFERDEKILNQIKLSETKLNRIESIISACENELERGKQNNYYKRTLQLHRQLYKRQVLKRKIIQKQLCLIKLTAS